MQNFRRYLLDRFPGAGKFNGFVPETTMYPDGGEEYDPVDIAGYIIGIFDYCGDATWGDIETYLGDEIFTLMREDLDIIPELDGDDRHDKYVRHAIYNNEDRSSNMSDSFRFVKDYFIDWVMQYYGNFDYGLLNLNYS